MGEKLFTEKISEKISAINDRLGVKVTLPKMTVSRQKRSALRSGTLGAGITGVGMVIGSKITLLVGGLVVGANILAFADARRIEKINDKKKQ